MQPKESPPTEVGVIVGRFQVDAFHDNHVELIEFVRSRHAKVVILLGCARFPGDRHDPLDYDSRRLMVQEKYPDVIILPLPDQRDNETWSRVVDSTVRNVLTPGQRPTLYGSRGSFIPSYSGKYPVIEIEDPKSVINISGTMVRNRLANTVQASQGFRAGAIWQAYNRWPEIKSTVDVIVFDFAKNRMLLGRKPGEKKFRFVGGFADVKDESDEVTASRELNEETGLGVSAYEMCYIGSANINDWRLRSSENKIRTRVFVAPYIFGAPKANDDIEELRWFPYTPELKAELVEEHQRLFELFHFAFNDSTNKYYPVLAQLKPIPSQI